MKILYGKQFAKDLDDYRLDHAVKKRLLAIIETIDDAESIMSIKNLRKIEGYTGYYRIRIGDYRLGMKIEKDRVEIIRFLHRKDIYRRFP